jgi:hypothetical protein
MKAEMGGEYSTYGENREACRVLVGKPKERKSLESPRRRREDNIKMDLKEVRWGAWTGSIWLRLRTNVNAVLNLLVP